MARYSEQDDHARIGCGCFQKSSKEAESEVFEYLDFIVQLLTRSHGGYYPRLPRDAIVAVTDRQTHKIT
jgi:hypothetical protein